MGDINQYYWIKKYSKLIQSPILEIGSKFYNVGTSVNYREVCDGMEYTGIDIFEGENVDIVVDLTRDIDQIRKTLGRSKYRTIICCSVLEHVNDLFTACFNIDQLLEKDGVMFVSVPFAWEFHGYPSDYWRFTPNGIKSLFRNFDFNAGNTLYSPLNDELHDLPENINDYSNIKLTGSSEIISREFTLYKNLRRMLKFLFNKDFRRSILMFKWLKSNRLIRATAINMIGVKR